MLRVVTCAWEAAGSRGRISSRASDLRDTAPPPWCRWKHSRVIRRSARFLVPPPPASTLGVANAAILCRDGTCGTADAGGDRAPAAAGGLRVEPHEHRPLDGTRA